MDRIAIIGCGCSGKSTVARQLARILDAPLTHLDAIDYDEHWTPLLTDEFAAQQEKLAPANGGSSRATSQRPGPSDSPPSTPWSSSTCRPWHVCGASSNAGGATAAASTVPTASTTGNFSRYILGYRRTMRPRVRSLLHDHGPHVRLITLNSRRHANRFIDRVTTGNAAGNLTRVVHDGRR